MPSLIHMLALVLLFPSAAWAQSAEAPASDAERITLLKKAIEDSEKQLAALREVDEEGGEYARAESEFQALDRELRERRRALQSAEADDDETRARSLREEIQSLAVRHALAKERFDLAIQDRKTRREQMAALEQKLQVDRDALQVLVAPPSTQPAAPTSAPAAAAVVPVEPPSPAPAAAAVGPLPLVQPPAAEAAASPSPPAEPPRREVVEAQERAQAKESMAQEAEKEVRTIGERIDAAGKAIELEKRRLETARRQRENAEETLRKIEEQLAQRRAARAPEEELNELRARIVEARQRSREAQVEVRGLVDRIDDLQDELAALQAERIAALEEAAARRAEAERARREVETLENPFTLQNMLRWLIDKGPRLAGIFLGMFVVLYLVRAMESRIVRLLASRGDHGTTEDRENRAKTLVSVFHNATSVVVIVGGLLMALTEVGVNIVPLLGGAAVVGLAVAFGAQNLIRDYFYGFMILLENQYGINDVVRIGEASGLVERVTMRVTVLRGMDGTVHFIPNGQINMVSNMTHNWSRAVFDIAVAYKENVEHVMEVLMQLARQLRSDPTFRQHILDDPEMLGVDALGDSGVVIRFIIKTRPLKQWLVKRALLARIKKRFDELGIEIPFPQRTVHHRFNGPPRGDGDGGEDAAGVERLAAER